MMNTKDIVINGRYSIKDDSYFFYNGGSFISFKMKGKGFSVSFNSKPKHGYFYVIIDRDYNNKIKAFTNECPFKFSFGENKTHYIDIVKANEANDNTFELTDLEVDGEMLLYDHQYDKKVRVFGDSTIAGYGILLKEGDPSVHNSDSVRDFCFHALYEMNMEMDIMSASGYGLVFSAYTCPQNIGLFDFIDKVSVGSQSAWKNTKCDLLIISLGCNDNSFIALQPNLRKENIKKFIDSYKMLIDSQIILNENLKILMVYGTLKEEDAYYLYEETYKCLKPMYKNLYIHKFKGDNTGLSNHAYVSAHDEMTEELKEVIKSIL